MSWYFVSCFPPRDVYQFLAFAGRLRIQQRAVAKEEPSRTSEHVTVQWGSKLRCRVMEAVRTWRTKILARGGYIPPFKIFLWQCVCVCVIFLSCEEKEFKKQTRKSLKSGLGLLTIIAIKVLPWWLSGSVIWTWFSLVAQTVKICLQCRRPPGLIPGSGRSPGEGNGNLLQYSCLGNPMDIGAWQATVHGVMKIWIWFNN